MKPDMLIQDHTELEELLHAFLDGELPVEREAQLFRHLANCDRCRQTFNSVMRFRQLSRQEFLPVPPSVDEAFFRRLEAHKVQRDARDRAAERKPLWQTRRSVSLRAVVLAVLFLLAVGLLAPTVSQEAGPYVVQSETERVEFRDVIYVIYPGLTVEATRL